MNTPFRYLCTSCGRYFERDDVTYLCPSCSAGYQVGKEPIPGVLEAVFDYEHIKRHWDPDHPDWDLFCCVSKEFHPPYAVGNTPLLYSSRLSHEVQRSIWIKNDGLNPSGSLKDRASFLVVAEALRLKQGRVVAASTGNAASALAAVCASAGVQAVIFVPKNAPRAKLVQMILYGATVLPVNGTYDDAFRLSLEFTAERGGLNRNTAYHPLTIEGKKTVAFEIFEQMGMKLPDVVFIPMGDGVIMGGAHKGFLDLMKAGITDHLPALVGCQAEKSNAIENLFRTGAYENAVDPSTVADSISVGAPANAYMAVRGMKESGGFPVLVSDAEIMHSQGLLARTTGIFAEPAASAALAGMIKCADKFPADAKMVILATGHGLKDVDASLKEITIPQAIDAVLSAVPADL